MNILIADDERLLRDAIADLIEKDAPNSVVRTCGSLPDAHRMLKEFEDIEVVLLDLYMPGMMGVSGAVEVLRTFPEKLVLLLSGSASSADMGRAYHSDLHGFISKDISGKALVAALRLIECGERYFPPRMRDIRADPVTSVTEREQMILKLLKTGSTNKSIAQSLGLEESLVKSILRSVGQKLGARTRTEIAIKASEMLDQQYI